MMKKTSQMKAVFFASSTWPNSLLKLRPNKQMQEDSQRWERSQPSLEVLVKASEQAVDSTLEPDNLLVAAFNMARLLERDHYLELQVPLVETHLQVDWDLSVKWEVWELHSEAEHQRLRVALHWDRLLSSEALVLSLEHQDQALPQVQVLTTLTTSPLT
jgi:hypothetical protein